MRRVLPALGIVFVAVAAFTSVRSGQSAAMRRTSTRSSRTCGVERWPVKTLTDPAAGTVNFTPRATTVDWLRALPRPRSLGARGRGVERTTYRVPATLIEFKREADSDIHLVIAQPGHRSHTMIVEFPDPSCTRGASAGARRRMTRARRAIEHACGQPSPTRFQPLAGSATVVGVGFFDFKHGQRGVAPNAIELHPVTGFSAPGCTE